MIIYFIYTQSSYMWAVCQTPLTGACWCMIHNPDEPHISCVSVDVDWFVCLCSWFQTSVETAATQTRSCSVGPRQRTKVGPQTSRSYKQNQFLTNYRLIFWINKRRNPDKIYCALQFQTLYTQRFIQTNLNPALKCGQLINKYTRESGVTRIIINQGWCKMPDHSFL